MHDGGGEDDFISRDNGSPLGPELNRINRVQDDSGNAQPSESLAGRPETISTRVAPQAFLERPLSAEDLATLRAFEVLSQAVEET